jgi:hypothetical protein
LCSRLDCGGVRLHGDRALVGGRGKGYPRGHGARRRDDHARLPELGLPDPEASRRGVGQARTWRQTPYVVDGVYVSVDDIDTHYEGAVAAGVTILSELENNPGIGQRQYRAEDLEGHRWMFATRL